MIRIREQCIESVAAFETVFQEVPVEWEMPGVDEEKKGVQAMSPRPEAVRIHVLLDMTEVSQAKSDRSNST